MRPHPAIRRLIAVTALCAAGAVAAETPRVLPVLSQESGRIEALLLLDEPASDSPRALDRVLGAERPATSAATLRLGRSTPGRIGAELSFDAQPGLALLCRGNIGIAAALGALGEHCLLADIGSDDPLLGGADSRRAGMQALWQGAESGIDLRFGLSWLEVGGAQSLAPLGSESSGLASPLVGLPGLAIDAWQVQFGGSGQVGRNGWLQLDGSTGRAQQTGLQWAGMPLRWDTTTLTLGGGLGNFSGTLTGRLIEVPGGARPSWVDLDLGVSWRTPWHAQFTVGARNLLGQPDASQWPLSSLPRSGEADTRTPYVRYHQDL